MVLNTSHTQNMRMIFNKSVEGADITLEQEEPDTETDNDKQDSEAKPKKKTCNDLLNKMKIENTICKLPHT